MLSLLEWMIVVPAGFAVLFAVLFAVAVIAAVVWIQSRKRDANAVAAARSAQPLATPIDASAPASVAAPGAPAVAAPPPAAPLSFVPPLAAPENDPPTQEEDFGASAPPDEPVAFERAVFEPIQKARIAGVDLVLRAHLVHFGDDDLLGFATEGFAALGRPELVVYVRPGEGDVMDVIRPALKFFSFVVLQIHERGEPVGAGEILAFPGQLSGLTFGGFLALEANEPMVVPMPDHLVLVTVPRDALEMEPAALRAQVYAQGGRLPCCSVAELTPS